MSMPDRQSREKTLPPKTFAAPRVGTSFTEDESNDHWFLCHVFPAGDVPSDPAAWPDWSDNHCWATGPDSPQRAVPDAPEEADYPF